LILKLPDTKNFDLDIHYDNSLENKRYIIKVNKA